MFEFAINALYKLINKDLGKYEDEQSLLLRISNSDQQAFAQLVERYTSKVYPYLLYWLKHAEMAEELTQDVFVRVWQSRDKLKTVDNFPGYLYVVTRNVAYSAIRKQLSITGSESVDKLNDLLSYSPSALELKELAGILRKGIELLPARRREVFILSRTGEMTYEEIAAKLHISRSAVRQHIVEALVFLRHYLKEYAGVIVSASPWVIAFFI